MPIIIGHKYRPQDTKLTSVYLCEDNMHFSIRRAGVFPPPVNFVGTFVLSAVRLWFVVKASDRA